MKRTHSINRRDFLRGSSMLGAAAVAGVSLPARAQSAPRVVTSEALRPVL